MFDEHARRLIESLPRLPGLDPVACRRALSWAYLLTIDVRVRATDDPTFAEEVSELRPILLQMANALESVAVFDPLNGVGVPAKTREASAFVAAEALSLIAELSPTSPAADDPIQDSRTYALMESALLFMIGGYDANASAVVSHLPPPAEILGQGRYPDRCRSGARLRNVLATFCRGEVLYPVALRAPELGVRPDQLADLADDTRTRLYESLVRCITGFLAWLGGSEDLETPRALVDHVRRSCGPGPLVQDVATLRLFPFSDVHHLASLIAAAIDATKGRSTVHVVPPPLDGDPEICACFCQYLQSRARGTNQARGLPLLWPSTMEYIHECLPGPNKDAVVSMPTGSGKSFLAELAVAHALTRGWVLYLAPTNALVHQIRRDLDQALKPFGAIKVTPFVGGAEYTTLSDEEVLNARFVGVMTPEKCALALRLYPDAFSQCSLCVFDECHLLNDPSRGVVVDVLLAQLFGKAPEMRTLLMSAMVANADELAGWLTAVRGHEAVPSTTKWRPSRAARCFVFTDADARRTAAAELDVELQARRGACTLSRLIPLGWLAGLSGPWTRDGGDDYRAARLPLAAELVRKRSRAGVIRNEFSSWKNKTGQAVAELLATHDIPAINFILSSRHHAFSAAGRVVNPMPGAIGEGPLPGLVEAQLAVADAELGVETVLRGLLRRGICVHTSAMLQVEQAASERMFREGKAKLMFATGTLAQGLNLPAIGVVISGSKVGDPRVPPDTDAAPGLTRASELILNGFGRAGRPGFSNQGVVVLVSDVPFSAPIAARLDGAPAIDQYPVLAEPDASVQVRSPIEGFIDDLMAPDEDDATTLEVALTSLLATVEGDGESAGTVLRRTFAGYCKRAQLIAEATALATARIADVKARFLEGGGVPNWMPRAAMKAGVEFFRAQRMWEACNAIGLVEPERLSSLSVRDWFNAFIEVMAHMPVSRVPDYLDTKKANTPLTRLGALARDVDVTDTVQWQRPDGWDSAWRDLGGAVLGYMAGNSLAEVGSAFLGTPVDEFPSGRADAARGGLPLMFKFVGVVVERALSRDAGCFLALYESWMEVELPGVAVPECLQALPLCVRNGCDSLDVLAWFRFGYRQRVCAHALADAFPLPDGVVNDAARSRAVLELRRQWLLAEPGGEGALLDSARVIVKDSSSQRT